MTDTNSYPKKPMHVSRIHPSVKEQWLRKATIYNQTGYYGKTLRACERAIQIDHNYSKAYSGKSLALCHLERYEEALLASGQAIRLNPNYANAYVGKGNALCGLKRFEEALAVYEQALQINPKCKIERIYIDMVYEETNKLSNLNLDRYKEHLTIYEQDIRLSPNDIRVHIDRAKFFYEIKHYYEEALIACERAIQLDSSNAKAYIKKAGINYELKRYEEALATYNQAIRLEPNQEKAYIDKGKTLYELRRYSEALAAYEQAIILEPNYDRAYIGKGRVLYELRLYEEALNAYRRASRTYSLGKVQNKGKGCDSVRRRCCQKAPWRVWLRQYITITPREEPMVQTHSRTAHDYAQWVSTLVAYSGSYGIVSGVSQQVGVARQTLYRWKAKGLAALEAAFAPTAHGTPPACPLEPAILTLLVEGHASYRGIQRCLWTLLGQHVSLGTIAAVVESAGKLAVDWLGRHASETRRALALDELYGNTHGQAYQSAGRCPQWGGLGQYQSGRGGWGELDSGPVAIAGARRRLAEHGQ